MDVSVDDVFCGLVLLVRLDVLMLFVFELLVLLSGKGFKCF